ncbi:MAG: DNA internalization-related competence protein ComEC/Rec2 [Halioglobus sp.]|nr:DNA internalization-related competence protein ComEC/Rec2 [Halioglobus sp.]
MQSWMIGMVSGTIFVGLWPSLPPISLCLMFAVIAAVALCWQTVAARVTCGVACGCFLGLTHGTVLLQHRLADDCVGVPLVITGIVSSLPTESRMLNYGLRQRFEFSVQNISPSRCAGPSKLILSYYGDDKIRPAQEWQFGVKLRKPWGRANPGSFNMQIWFAQRAVDGIGSIRKSSERRQAHQVSSLFVKHHRLRQIISERIARLDLNPEVLGILRAITVADKAGIDHQMWKLFQQFGINHLLVISGLHVGMIAAVGYLLGGIVQRLINTTGFLSGCMPGAFALVMAWLYSAMAGFSLPTQRALCMLNCFVIAALATRKSGASRNLLMAATVVLTVNPLAAVGSGFWLSFGAVAALLWLAKWQHGMRAIPRLLRTHGFMALVMLPLGALFFGGGSLVAMLANLLMIPLIGLVVVPLALLALVTFLSGWPVEAALWQLAGWPLEQILPWARGLSSKGGTLFYLPLTANLPQAIAGMVAVILLMLPGRSVLKLLIPILALPLLLPLRTPSNIPSLDTRVTVLDVGQGTAVVVSSGEQVLVYDTGGGNPDGMNMGTMVVLPFLQMQGVSALDTLVISHPDLDHSAGAEDVLAELHIGRVRFGGDDEQYSKGRSCIAGESWRWPGGQIFQFLSPAIETALSRNNSSCVLQIEVGNYRLLLPGDIDNERERTLVRYWGKLLNSEWLLAAHHGSKTSSSLTFLKHTRPQAVVISSGYANRFGHPHLSVTRRLQDIDASLYLTASDGAVEFTIVPGKAMEVSVFREFYRRYWL